MNPIYPAFGKEQTAKGAGFEAATLRRPEIG